MAAWFLTDNRLLHGCQYSGAAVGRIDGAEAPRHSDHWQQKMQNPTRFDLRPAGQPQQTFVTPGVIQGYSHTGKRAFVGPWYSARAQNIDAGT